MKTEAWVKLDNGTTIRSAMMLTQTVADSDICVDGFYVHTKASEKYVVATYAQGGVLKKWVIPYQYRRTDTFIDTESDMISLIKRSKEKFAPKYILAFKNRIRKKVYEIFGHGASVTVPIFLQLLDNCGEWVWNKNFRNENPQRRIQEIKETGFTISTMFGEGRKTYHMLLPFDPVKSATYEVISQSIRRQIFSVHDRINAFTGEPLSTSCLPDHKFPEIRWDKDTAVSNEELTHTEMREKFQIVPENVNQMKREVCRKCFQTSLRGKLNGIKFFYKGTEKWNPNIPKTGKLAEKGCVGCFWYDMLAWREALHKRLGV